MNTWKEIIGAILGVLIAVLWVSYAVIAPGSMLFLAIAIVGTIILGILTGGLYAMAKKEKSNQNA
jgi:uncharacterized protein YacL